jgi:YD repeat-containing protein
MAATYDGTLTGTVYLDGQEIGNGSFSAQLATDTTGPLTVGNDPNNNVYIGSLEEVAVYPLALSPARINAHWIAGAGQSCPTTPTSAYATAVLADHPSRFYRLSEPSGRAAWDSGGSCTSASYSPSVVHVAGGLTGDPGDAVSTPSAGGPFVTAGADAVPSGASARTVEAWFKTGGSAQTILSYGTAANRFTIYEYTSELSIYSAQGTVSVATPYSVADGNWHSMAATYDGNVTGTLYLDGQEIGNGSFSAHLTTDTTGALTVGNDPNNNVYTGSLAEVAVYPQALSPARLNAHWTAGLAGQCPATPSSAYASAVLGDLPARYWRLGERGGAVAWDATGSCTGATYSGSTTHIAGALAGDPDGAAGNPTPTGAFVTASADTLPSGRAARTVEAWFKTTSSSQTVLSYGTASNRLTVFEYTNQIAIYTPSQGQLLVSTPYGISDGNWHYVAATYDGNLLGTVYLDGQDIARGNFGATLQTDTSGSLTVGRDPNGNNFTGSIDEIAVYPTALTSQAIVQHWRTGQASGCPTGADSPYASAVLADTPVRFLPLSQTQGPVATDYSSSSGCRPAVFNPAVRVGVGGIISAIGQSSVNPPNGGAFAVGTEDDLPAGAAARTVEGWFATTASSQAVVSYGSGSNRFDIFEYTNQLSAYSNSQGIVNMATPYPVSDGHWHQVAIVYDGGTAVTIYLDGSAIGSGAFSGPLATDVTSGQLLIGADPGNNFTGNLEAVAVYPTALSSARILAHYNAATAMGGAFTSAPTGYDGCVPCAGASAREGTATSWPVNTANGNFWHSFSDISIPGRSLPLGFNRTYNSVNAATNGPLGYGWQSNVGMSLSVSGSSAAITEENASTVSFTLTGSTWSPAAPRFIATLTHNGDDTWTFIRQAQDTYTFNGSGQLTSYKDLNGYTTTYGYTSGNVTSITDPAGRVLGLTWSGTHIMSVSDANASPSRSVMFQYNDGNGNLTDAFDVNGGHWQYTYDSSHRMTTMRDPECVLTSGCTGVQNVYDSQGRVSSQTDPLGRATSFDYTSIAGATKVTDPAGNVRVDYYNEGLRVAVTKGYGTPAAATWSYAYDPATLALITTVDPDGHEVSQTVDSSGNVLTTTDALGRTTSHTYNAFNQVLTTTDPLHVTTTGAYDAHGNLSSVSRPLVGSGQTQTVTYRYSDNSHPGDITSIVDPDGNVWTYAYDGYGDRVSSSDPLGEETTQTYDAHGWMLSTVSPKGNVSDCGCANQYTTTYSYSDPQSGVVDEFGDVRVVTDPLGHATSYGYDADRNRVSQIDGTGNLTRATYDLDNELTVTTRADQTVTKTDYNPDGTVHDQVDGKGNPIQTYGYDGQARNTAITDALGNVTTFGYDAAGNRLSRQDPGGSCVGMPAAGCTTMTYDAANELVGVTYSDGSTPNVTYAYDADGERTAMTDGTGSSGFSWDSLHRLTSATNGNGQTVAYGYNLRGLTTSITYPGSGKLVTRGYDIAGRWTSVSDWLSPVNRASFTYDPNGNLTAAAIPGGVTDTYTFNAADQLTAIADTAGSNSVFSATYARDANGQVAGDTSAPAAQSSYRYTPLTQLCYAGSSNASSCTAPPSNSYSYAFDGADNLTQTQNPTQTGVVTQTFNAADQLCWMVAGTSSNSCGSPPANATSYAYDARGNRTAAGSVSYAYDQSNRLTNFNGGQATFAYNGDQLRMSRSSGGTTTQFTWDTSGAMPLLLEQTSGAAVTDIVYGPGGVPIEQINPGTPAITHVGTPATAADSNGTGASLTLTLSSGVQAGDQIIVATTYPAQAGNSATAPSGYTQVSSVNSGGAAPTADVTQVFRKTVTGADRRRYLRDDLVQRRVPQSCGGRGVSRRRRHDAGRCRRDRRDRERYRGQCFRNHRLRR